VIVLPDTYSITVHIAQRQLKLYRNDRLMQIYTVAVGAPETPTPTGRFTVINKAVNPGGPFGTRWLGLSAPHIGIHSTNAPGSIGKAVSHGCIRMHNKDIEAIFPLMDVGASVKIE
jgi:lipoprotein-anchoring transpeptidase ErfK/SrfK